MQKQNEGQILKLLFALSRTKHEPETKLEALLKTTKFILPILIIQIIKTNRLSITRKYKYFGKQK